MIGRRILERAGATIDVAADGAQAVHMLTENPNHYDLVLMDIQMPEMDGYETTYCIRKKLGLTDLPIIAMTANALASDRENCLVAGMNDHVSKPLEIDVLLSSILRWVKKYE
jgi:CheY-like chemotaxis protein